MGQHAATAKTQIEARLHGQLAGCRGGGYGDGITKCGATIWESIKLVCYVLCVSSMPYSPIGMFQAAINLAIASIKSAIGDTQYA